MTLLPERTITLPDFSPATVRSRLSGSRHTFVPSRGARLRARSPERILPSHWNEKFRVMPDSESYPGKWQHDIAPHSADIMDLWAQPSVRELWFCAVDQASKTASMIGCIQWSLDQAPGNIFYTAAGEAKTKEIVSDKLVAGLRATPKLKKLISSKADDTGLGKIKLLNGVHIRVAWANSPASTASFSAKYTFNDEVDKWDMVGMETDPIRRIRKRTKNYPNSYKHFFASTPAGKYIYKNMMSCQQVVVFAARCPDCGEMIIMDKEHFTIGSLTIDEIKAQPALVEYSCNICGTLWDETKRLQAYRTGRMVCIKGADVREPVDIGVHVSGFVTPDIKMAVIAVAIIEARSGDLGAKRDLANGYEAVDFIEETGGAVTEEHLLKFKSELPRNLVPVDCAMLIITIDTQQAGFYYQIWALGYSPAARMHMVNHDFTETFEDLTEIISKIYISEDSREIGIIGGFIDSGGSRAGYKKHSRTVEVYDWCTANKKIRPLKGLGSASEKLLSYQDIYTYPGSNRKLRNAISLVKPRVSDFKDILADKLAYQPDNSNALSFHCEIDPQFAKHYTGETKIDEHSDWIHSKKQQRIDYWDCTVYALAYREMIKLRIPRKPESQDQQPAMAQIKSGSGFVQGWRR